MDQKGRSDTMQDKPRRPGYLTDYARHAGISKQAAADQLKRIGVDYLQPFDFEEADRLRAAMRHAARLPFAKEILLEDDPEDTPEGLDGAQSKGNPTLTAWQIKKEEVRTYLLQLQYRKELGELVEKKKVAADWLRITRQIRDGMENLPPRLGGPLAAESDPRRVEDLLMKEIRQILEVLSDGADAIGKEEPAPADHVEDEPAKESLGAET